MNVLSLLRPATPVGASRITGSLEGNAPDLLSNGNEVVDRHQEVPTQVDGRGNQVFSVQDLVNPTETIVDVHETAGLAAVDHGPPNRKIETFPLQTKDRPPVSLPATWMSNWPYPCVAARSPAVSKKHRILPCWLVP